MTVLSVPRLISFLALFATAVAQIPSDLPIGDRERQYLEGLPPDKQPAILEIYMKGIEGQVPAPPDTIAAQELNWSYGRSPPVYPTREFNPP